MNTHGRRGKNIPCDLHMEHLNRMCKSSISGLGSNVTDRSIQRIGECLSEVAKVVQAYDEENSIKPISGKHRQRSDKKDCMRILDKLNSAQVFISTPGRSHVHFPNFVANPAQKLSLDTLKEWMEEHLKHLV